MASTAGLVEPFKARVEQLLAASAGKVTITSGFRTREQQIALRKKNGCPDVMHSRPNDCRITTAIPGTSKHERGEAVDFGGDLEVAAQLAPRFGLHRTVNVGTPREEKWHYELDPSWVAPKEDQMTDEQWEFLQAMNDKLDTIRTTQETQNARLAALEAAVKAG